MSTVKGGSLSLRCIQLAFYFVLILMVAVPQLCAADKNKEDFDAYTLRIDGYWFGVHPSGSIEGLANGFVDFHKDLALGAYSTYTGRIDCQFTRENHLFFAATPFNRSRQVVHRLLHKAHK